MIRGNEGQAISQDRVDRLAEEEMDLPQEVVHPEDNVNNNNDSEKTSRFAIWNLDLHTTKQVWNLLERILRVRMYRQITAVRRVTQRSDGRIRFEVDVPRNRESSTRARLNKAKYRFNFWFKLWALTPAKAVGEARPARRRERDHLDSVRLCSLNINGVAPKVARLREYIEDKKIHTVCLQETLRKPNHWRLHLQNFGCVEQPSEPGAGRRGLAMAIMEEHFTAFPVGVQSDFFQFQRVYGSRLTRPFVIGHVYLPHRHVQGEAGPLWNEAWDHLKRNIGNLRRKYPNDPVIAMGDFNITTGRLNQRVSELLGMRQLSITGDRRTRVRKGNGGGDIDHALISTEHMDWVIRCWIDNECDLSDHWPVMLDLAAQIRGEIARVMDATPRWQVAKLKTLKRESSGEYAKIATNNRFQVLADDSVEEAAEHFIEQCNAVGDEIGIRQPPKQRCAYKSSKAHQRAADKQRRLYLKLINAKNSGHELRAANALTEYRAQRVRTKALLRTTARQRWAKKVVQACADFRDNPKDAWAWTSTTAGWRRKGGSLGIQPVMDVEGNLCTNPERIDAAWTAHYQGLARDTIGNSQNFEHWKEVIPDRVGEGTTSRKVTAADLAGLNEDIREAEVETILFGLKSWKAPGGDRIPVDFMKIFIGPKGAITPAIAALTNICNKMFREGSIPDVWTTAMVVSIFKKGDPTDCGNYRGISLMDSTLKVLLTILTARLQRTLELRGMVVREQAGFRPREECMGQVMTLYEILRRRYLNQENTYLLFLDFQKAYDVVPHGALFRELEVLGITGRILTFIKVLYARSRVAVRTVDGRPGPAFSLERGLRQGCPMSPILFTVFINTIFDGEENNGCTVPGVPGERIQGLMFADDTVGLAGDLVKLHKTLKRVTEWSETHGMTFGVGKCALMACIWNNDASVNAEVFADKSLWNIDGADIPTPEQYTYLGIVVKPILMHNKDDGMVLMVDEQLEKGRKALFALRPFLTCPTVPQHIKVNVVRCVVQAKMLWGAELWGMSQKRVCRAQTVMNDAMRDILGVRGPKAFMSVGCMMRELRMQPVWALVSSRRVRIYYKFPTLSTWARLLTTYRAPPARDRSRRRTWLSQTEQWIKTMHIRVAEGQMLTAGSQVPVETAVEATRISLTKRWLDLQVNTTSASTLYDLAGYRPLMRVKDTFPPAFGRGMTLIQQFRANGYWTRSRTSKLDLFGDSVCPFCTQGARESIPHILLECGNWHDMRERFLGKDIPRWRMRLGFARDGPLGAAAQQEVCIVALGGEVRGYRARHYYPAEVKYSLAEAIAGTVDDPPADDPGPIDYRHISPPRPRRGPNRPPVPRRYPQWEAATPEFMWPSSYGREIVGTPDRAPEEGTPVLDTPEADPWGLDQQIDQQRGIQDQDQSQSPQEAPVDRQLHREFDQEDECNGPNTPLWSRCSLFSVAAFLTKVDQSRVARIDELQLADEAEFSNQSPGRDGYG
jgi:exonuclease III